MKPNYGEKTLYRCHLNLRITKCPMVKDLGK